MTWHSGHMLPLASSPRSRPHLQEQGCLAWHSGRMLPLAFSPRSRPQLQEQSFLEKHSGHMLPLALTPRGSPQLQEQSFLAKHSEHVAVDCWRARASAGQAEPFAPLHQLKDVTSLPLVTPQSLHMVIWARWAAFIGRHVATCVVQVVHIFAYWWGT